MITERIKFYSDTPTGEKNKYFVFSCPFLDSMKFLMQKHSQGWHIRSAWYELYDSSRNKSIINQRIQTPVEWLNQWRIYSNPAIHLQISLTCFIR